MAQKLPKPSLLNLATVALSGFVALYRIQLATLLSVNSLSILAVAVLGSVFGIGSMIFSLLQQSTSRMSSNSDTESNAEVLTALDTLSQKVDDFEKKIKNDAFSQRGLLTLEIENTVNDRVKEKLKEINLLDFIQTEYSREAMSSQTLNLMRRDFEELRFRLRGQISQLRVNANLNLAYGSSITIATAGLIAYDAYTQTVDFTSLISLLSHFVPRLTIIIFIEVFAFFFLKNYKSNLADIKYYNNEITNIDSKTLAFTTAILIGSLDTQTSVINELIKTERNFKLLKDESTIELERDKIEAGANKQLLETLASLIKMKS